MGGPTGPGPRICVLSGGALKTLAHLGVVHEFRRRGLSFDLHLGCSGGAILAALLGAGMEPRKALDIFRERARDFLRGSDQPRAFGFLPSWFTGLGPGLADTASLKPLLTEYLPGDSFDGLPGLLGVNAIHLRSGAEVLFTGPGRLPEGVPGLRLCRRQTVGEAVRASISLPVLFKPTLLTACADCRDRTCGIPRDPREPEGDYFIDGGFRSHLPLAAAWAARPSLVLACDARFEGPGRRLPVAQWSLSDVLHRTGDIAMRGQVERQLASAPPGATFLVISPPDWDSALFDTDPTALESSFACGSRTAAGFLSSLGFPSGVALEPGDLAARLAGPVTVYAPDE